MGLFDKLLKGAVDAIDNAAAKNGNGPTGLKDLFDQAMDKKNEAINGSSSTTTSSKPSTATSSTSSSSSSNTCSNTCCNTSGSSTCCSNSSSGCTSSNYFSSKLQLICFFLSSW